MFPNQRFRELEATKTECANLADVKSQFCWCDPIVEIDDYGQKVVVHIEVTWHPLPRVETQNRNQPWNQRSATESCGKLYCSRTNYTSTSRYERRQVDMMNTHSAEKTQ